MFVCLFVFFSLALVPLLESWFKTCNMQLMALAHSSGNFSLYVSFWHSCSLLPDPFSLFFGVALYLSRIISSSFVCLLGPVCHYHCSCYYHSLIFSPLLFLCTGTRRDTGSHLERPWGFREDWLLAWLCLSLAVRTCFR